MIDDMSTTPDRETLRALADEGNEKALDRLADLADERGDVEELSELLDEGAMHGGQLLTRRAVAAADLVELQRISDRFERQGGLTASFSRRSTSGIPAGDAAPAGYRDPHAL